jgi:hypothetical protein
VQAATLVQQWAIYDLTFQILVFLLEEKPVILRAEVVQL